MRDILLRTEVAGKSLADSILTTKRVRLQTQYMGAKKAKVTLLGVPLYISEDHLFFVFFSKFV